MGGLGPAPAAQSISQASPCGAGRSRALLRTWHRAQSRAADTLTPKARPTFWPAAPDVQPAPDKHWRVSELCKETGCGAAGLVPAPGGSSGCKGPENVPRLPKLLLSPSTAGDPAHTSGHRCHTSLFSSFIKHCWRRGLCRGQASPVCGCAVGQRLGRRRVGQVALAGEALPVPAAPLLRGAWGR